MEHCSQQMEGQVEAHIQLLVEAQELVDDQLLMVEPKEAHSQLLEVVEVKSQGSLL